MENLIKTKRIGQYVTINRPVFIPYEHIKSAKIKDFYPDGEEKQTIVHLELNTNEIRIVADDEAEAEQMRKDFIKFMMKRIDK